MQLGRVDSQPVLIADVDRNAGVAAQVSDVLIDECERRIRGPPAENVGLRDAVDDGKIEIQWRLLRVWRPCRGARERRAREKGELLRIRGRLHFSE
jgi:hypothetical protein